MPLKVTETPSWQSRSMIARPMPVVPPVTIAAWSLSPRMDSLLKMYMGHNVVGEK